MPLLRTITHTMRCKDCEAARSLAACIPLMWQRRQRSQDITFSGLVNIWPRFTFCFSNNIIHTRGGEVYTPFKLRTAMRRPFQEKKEEEEKKKNPKPFIQSYCAFWTKGTMCVSPRRAEATALRRRERERKIP